MRSALHQNFNAEIAEPRRETQRDCRKKARKDTKSTKRISSLLLRVACWLLAGLSAVYAASVPPKSPLFFEELPASHEAPFRYVSRGANYLFGIGPAEARIVLQKTISASETPAFPGRAQKMQSSFRSIELKFLGANPAAAIEPTEELPGKINYFIGNDPSKWRCDVPMFGRVRVREVYPGVSLSYYGNQQLLEYDLELSPGADVNAIAMRFEGVESLRIDDGGDLVIRLGSDEIRQLPPVIYSVSNSNRCTVKGGYQLRDSNTVGLTVAAYDKSQPLVIDPMISYSTYFGGSAKDRANAVKVDANGFIYIAGETISSFSSFSFAAPLPAFAYSTNFHGGTNNGDAFVAKFDNTATNPPLYFSYIGGSADDSALDLAVDSAQHVYITGFTVSQDFPASYPANAFGLTNRIGGTSDPVVHAFPTDAFVTELDTTISGTNSLKLSAYIGAPPAGAGLADEGVGIALDAGENIYISGFTYSTNFPVTTNNAYQIKNKGSNDVFVAKIGPHGNQGLVYCTYLGGTNLDEGMAIAVSGSRAFITGYTASTNFPMSSPAILKP